MDKMVVYLMHYLYVSTIYLLCNSLYKFSLFSRFFYFSNKNKNVEYLTIKGNLEKFISFWYGKNIKLSM